MRKYFYADRGDLGFCASFRFRWIDPGNTEKLGINQLEKSTFTTVNQHVINACPPAPFETIGFLECRDVM